MSKISKPRVFLSHSKKDIEFIERLESELRKCQIEPWLDEIELRHGKPWLDGIFADGIPSCDAVLVYFTENSLASKVVKKELDAGVVSQLDDGSVSLFPYVSSPELREDLRSDIRALQVPEWNDENFEIVLARCVAEIWRSFHERRVECADRTDDSNSQREYCGVTFVEMFDKLQGRDLFACLKNIKSALDSSDGRRSVEDIAHEITPNRPDLLGFNINETTEEVEWREKYRKNVNRSNELINTGLLVVRRREVSSAYGLSLMQKDCLEISEDGKRFLNRIDAQS